MDLRPKKPKSKDFAPDKPLADAIAKTKDTPADTKALETAHKDVEKTAKELKAAMEKSHKAFDKAFQTLPDVTKGSPKPGPVPIPYPVFSKLEKDAKTAVKGADKALRNHEKAQKKLVQVIDKETKTLSQVAKSSGDEAGMARKGLISSRVKGKAKFQSFSMDVKVEGKNVAQFFDIAAKNLKNGK